MKMAVRAAIVSRRRKDFGGAGGGMRGGPGGKGGGGAGQGISGGVVCSLSVTMQTSPRCLARLR